MATLDQDNDNQFGWLGIITKVFDNKNSFLLTAFSALASAVVCVVAYLYQRIILLSWEIPAELIGDARNETIFYYVGFGILYALATIINQIILRYTSLNTRVAWSIYGVVKRTVKAAKRCVRATTKDKARRSRDYEVLANCKKQIGSIARKRLVKEIIKELFITALSLIPVCIMFQMASTSFSSFSLAYVMPAVLIVAAIGGFIQAGLLMPQKIRELVERSKHIKRNNKTDIFSILNQTNQVLVEWQKSREASSKQNTLEKMWNTISHVDMYSAIVTVTFNILLLIMLATTAPLRQESFWIFEDTEQHQTYAAVYFNKEKVVLKKAYVQQNTIFIQLHDQLYETCEGKNLAYKQFNRTILDQGALAYIEQSLRRD